MTNDNLQITSPFKTRWNFWVLTGPSTGNSRGLIVKAARKGTPEGHWDVSAGFGRVNALALRDFLVEHFGVPDGYSKDPESEPTVRESLDKLPLRSVIKFDQDFRARYTRTHDGWKDVGDGYVMSDAILDAPASRWPFEVKYNPKED